MWHRYAEFLRENGRRPDYGRSKERSLCVWYRSNLSKSANKQLDDEQKKSFTKLTDSGDTYRFYVVNRKADMPRLVFFGRKGNIFGKTIGDDSIRFDEACRMYVEFCYRMERHPWIDKREEAELAKWYLDTKDRYSANKLSGYERRFFDRLLQKTAEYGNYNDIKGVPELPDGKADEVSKESLQSAADGTKQQTGGEVAVDAGRKKRNSVKQDATWNRKWQAYVDYVCRNSRRPSKHRSEDMVLFDWFKHSKRLLTRGQMRADRVDKFRLLLGDVTDIQNIGQPDDAVRDRESDRADIHLYDYQADMKQRIEKAFLESSSVMVQMPTGTGKTHVIASVVRDFVLDGMGKVWVVAHRRELVSQIRSTLELYLTESEMGHILATSIQWLSAHYREISESPGLIVIDEAHHAVAKTYATVMDTYPMAKKLGVTATPYRLSGAGFRDLFQVLLTSWDIKTFIKKGYLCPFDYYCITKNSVEMFKVDGLKKRGADGDYQVKELNEKFNQSVVISRLFESYQKLARGKRGFVYAISIDHAENIARYYREHGVEAVAVSSQTPDAERERDIEDFRNGRITVLCSVDLFSEGFDAPDAEFIQLARPTLSLAKYLQMVGRGLRVASGKGTCVILDNVGLKDKFGLPSRERNWTYYFNGGWRSRGRRRDYADEDAGIVEKVLGTFIGPVDSDDMVLEISHDDLTGNRKILGEYKVVGDSGGRLGIADKAGNSVLPREYDSISISENGYASVKWGDTTLWYDLLNGLWYDDIPEVGYVGSVPVAYVKHTFYPRLRSQWINSGNGISEREMLYQFGGGLDWKGLFITWEGKPAVYKVTDSRDSGARLLLGEDGRQYVQSNPKSKPVSAGYVKDIEAWFRNRKDDFDEFARKARKFPIEYADTDTDRLQRKNLRIWKDEAGIITVTKRSGKQYWIDSETGRKFNRRPRTQRRGKADLLYIGDYVFIRNSPGRDYPYQDWQIRSDRNRIYIDNAGY